MHENLVTDKGCEIFNTYWKGYTDADWWYSVASSEMTKTVVGDKGTEKTFQINFATNKVKEVKGKMIRCRDCINCYRVEHQVHRCKVSGKLLMASELFLGTVYTMGKEERLKCKDFVRSKKCLRTLQQ